MNADKRLYRVRVTGKEPLSHHTYYVIALTMADAMKMALEKEATGTEVESAELFGTEAGEGIFRLV